MLSGFVSLTGHVNEYLEDVNFAQQNVEVDVGSQKRNSRENH